MAQELPDRRNRLFGRERDLSFLHERVRFKGLTAVVARPQMGKSWLLTELGRRLSRDPEQRYLVGIAESSGQAPDLLLRAVVDLYERWLSNADHRQQAKMVWDQQKPNVLPAVATTVGKIFSATAGAAAKPLVVAIQEAIDGLISVDKSLTTGGIQLPALQYNQARDLVATVAKISGQPVALILDQWEKSPDPKFEVRNLDGFLHHLDDWPSCHIFMALRPDESAFNIVERLVASLPGPAEIHLLQPMAFEHEDERSSLVKYIRKTVPAAAHVGDDDILDLVDHYPGVIYQWTGDYQREHMTNQADLARVAGDAQRYRFSELEELLPSLHEKGLRLVIRLALVPPGEPAVWRAIQAELLDGIAEDVLDDLRLLRVLEDTEPPSFGHAKRGEAVRSWVIQNAKARARSEAVSLIDRLASLIRDVTPRFRYHMALLWSLLSTSRELSLDEHSMALCQAAAALFGDFDGVDDALVRGAQGIKAAESSLKAPLLAMGLLNTLVYAKDEGDLAWRDLLLEELCGLVEAHPDDASIREGLAMALVNTMLHAKHEGDLDRRNRLLTELRELSEAYPDDAAVREKLAIGLNNALVDAEKEKNQARWDALLGVLRALAEDYPDDAVVKVVLSKHCQIAADTGCTDRVIA